MAILDDRTRRTLEERLARSLTNTVELRLHRRPDTGRLILPGGMGCATCDTAEELARALRDVAPGLIELTVVDTAERPEDGVEAVPTLTVGRASEPARIVFQGLPSGYEFATLVDAVERVSGAGGELSPESLELLAGLERDVEVMVFVTPTCPYCPGAASLANRMALASPRVRAVVVEANEFPDLSDRFDVQGVPRTVVNRAGAFVGALPEAAFVQSVLELAGREAA
ncbi:MAG TPA: thioredoxin family protein [Candidatus Eisenbacteria bacterium]|nr:thioredoxin family protein [Candidatus Eisenbacteria bacterium]